MRLLERHELGVAELCDVLQLPQSTVSRHLRLLADQGWVRSRAQGTSHFYRTSLDEVDASARRLWSLARDQIEQWVALQQDELRLQRRLQDRQTESQAFFAGAAGEWDKLRSELYGTAFHSATLAALVPPDWTVADLGCGTGQLLAELAPNVRRLIGVDNSAAMLKAARRRLGEPENVDLRRGDLQALPIEDGSCDAALLILALTYVENPPGVLREAARVLRPGGRVVVVDLLPHDRDDFRVRMGQLWPGFSLNDVRTALHEAGLTPSIVRPLPPEPQAKGPALFLATATRPPPLNGDSSNNNHPPHADNIDPTSDL